MPSIRPIAISALLLCILPGCDAPERNPISVQPSANPTMPVTLLVEKDGVKVYRFRDEYGYRVYFTVPSTGGSSTQWSEQQGKTNVRQSTN